jgi:hypothetical protein
MSLEHVVSLGALLSTVASFAGMLLHRRRGIRPELDDALQDLKSDTQVLHRLSVDAVMDKSLSPAEIRRLQEAIDRIQRDIKRAGSKSGGDASSPRQAGD